MYRRVLPYLAIVAVLACNAENSTQPPAPLPSSASPVISDGAHAGNPDFFFLNPTVPNPKLTLVDPFNGSLLPLVTICELDLPNVNNDGAVVAGTACRSGGYYEELQLTAANVDLVAEKYQVDWMVPIADAVYYRIRVIVGTKELGYADVKTGPTPQALKGTDQDALIPRIDGSDLPIKFRIEQYALCAVPGTGPCSSETVNLATGGTVSTTLGDDTEPTGVEIQPGSGVGTTTVTIEECTNLNPRATDLPTFGRCARVTADPPLTTELVVPAIVFICSAPADIPTTMSATQKARVTLHRFDEGPPAELNALPHADACNLSVTSSGVSLRGMLAKLVRGRFKSAGGDLIAMLAPKPLFATAMLDEGGGGETDFFSDFQFALPARLRIVSGNGQTASPGSTLPNDPTVIVEDLGTPAQSLAPEPVAGAKVTFSTTDGSATPATFVTLADGLASTAWTLKATPGANVLTAGGRGLAGSDVNGPRTGVDDPFQPIQAAFDGADPSGGPVKELVRSGTVTFSATGVTPIVISGFAEPRNRAPLINASGTPGSNATTLVSALQNPSNFGASGTVACAVQFQPFVQTIATGSLVSGGNRLVDVFFAGLTATTLTAAEATELAAFVNAGGILYIAGNSLDNEGPSYHPLFTALGASTTYNATIVGANDSQSSDPPDITPFTNGPFGAVGPLGHTPFRGIQPGSMTGLATGEGTTEQILVEGAFGTGRLSAMGDPLYFNLFTNVDSDNLNYFLNLFALGCTVPSPS